MVVQTSGNNFTRVNDWCYYNFAHVFSILKFEFYFKRIYSIILIVLHELQLCLLRNTASYNNYV